MSLGRTLCVVMAGLEAHIVTVEADIGDGLPGMIWTG
ncbi:MAG: ATP-binding protein, partial [Frankiaceae bacterium]|nr:ATP-binding protein [Frankiaceae bacterium]